MTTETAICYENINPLKLESLVDDIHIAWWNTSIEDLSKTGNELKDSTKDELVQKWSDESRIPVDQIKEVSDNLINCCLWLAKFKNRGQIYSGIPKIYYKLKFRKLATEYLNIINSKAKSKHMMDPALR